MDSTLIIFLRWKGSWKVDVEQSFCDCEEGKNQVLWMAEQKDRAAWGADGTVGLRARPGWPAYGLLVT